MMIIIRDVRPSEDHPNYATPQRPPRDVPCKRFRPATDRGKQRKHAPRTKANTKTSFPRQVNVK